LEEIKKRVNLFKTVIRPSMRLVAAFALWGYLLQAPYSLVQAPHSLVQAQYSLVQAQSRTILPSHDRDPRGAEDLVICSQNLQMFGTFKSVKREMKGMTQARYNQKVKGLIDRFTRQECDIIGVQELLGKPGKGLEDGINILTDGLSKGGRSYGSIYGEGEDRFIRVGYLYAKDKVTPVRISSYRKVELPRLLANNRPQFYLRAPLEVEFAIRGEKPKKVIVVNIHFKSQAGGSRDPSQLDWETVRMEMAEGLRRVLAQRYKDDIMTGKRPVVIVGDRNSHLDSASAMILEGRLRLSDFSEKGLCRISSKGVPLCRGGAGRGQVFSSVLTTDPQTGKLEGSHYYKGKGSWLDDILLSTTSLKFARKSSKGEGDYDSGLISEPKDVSDHAMAYVKLNW
jgi:predicted extracellular nuclease